MKSPCKDCCERCYKCHSNCERYLKFRAELDETNEQKRSEDFNNYYYEKYRRIQRRHK